MQARIHYECGGLASGIVGSELAQLSFGETEQAVTTRARTSLFAACALRRELTGTRFDDDTAQTSRIVTRLIGQFSSAEILLNAWFTVGAGQSEKK